MAPQPIEKPLALRVGDRIRLVAPASPFDREKFIRGRALLEQAGFQPLVDRIEFTRKGFLTGDDADRAERLQGALLETDTRAVWGIRGGYGMARLMPYLDLDRIRRQPKLLIGFSDLTVLLLNLSRPAGFVTLHGPVLTQWPSVPASLRNWLLRLAGEAGVPGPVPVGRVRQLVPGRATGRLAVANLSVLASLAGTPYMPDLCDCILCLEDVGEKAYRLDRLFVQLRQAGVLDGVRGVVLGSLAGCRPTGASTYSARATLERAVSELNVPCLAGASFGHIDRNVALPNGVTARLDTKAGSLRLLEPAVRTP